MYQVSRAIYRELVGGHRRRYGTRTSRCFAHARRRSSAWSAIATTSRARRATLFSDIRPHFPMHAQPRVWRVVQGYVDVRARRPGAHAAERVRRPTASRCSAAPRRAAARRASAMPLHHNGYCPSHQHLAETEEIELVASSRWPSRSPRSARPASPERRARASSRVRGMLLGVDVGGTFTDAVLVAGGVVHTAKAPTTPDDQSRGRHGRRRARARRARARGAGDVEGFAHGMTVATNALLEGTRRAHRVRRHRGLHRRRRARPPGAARALPAVRRAPGAARRRPSGASPRASAPGPTACCEPLERPRRAGRRGGGRRARGGRRLPAAQPTATPTTSARSATRCASASATSTSRSRTRSSGPSASSSARRRPRSTPRSPRCSRATCAACCDARARRGPARPRRSCSPAAAWPALDAAADHAALTVLSGPAGGAAAAALLAERCGEPDLLCFDMGGTSCDVCVVEGGRVRETTAREVGGRPLALPMVDIHTVGAGGGSIGWRDPGGALRVGPAQRGRRARARVLRPRRHRADGHRRQPRPRPPRAPTCRWPAASRSTPTRRTRPSSALADALGPRRRATAPRASCASPTPRWCARCA